MEDLRLTQLTQWARSQPGLTNASITVASADASFRRYFRVESEQQHFILMDAPPDKEDTGPFIDISRRLEAAGLPAPHIHAMDTEQGFLLLDDFGDESLLAALSDDNVERWYSLALDHLITMQSIDIDGLPAYDKALLMREMELFPEWFLGTHLGIELSTSERRDLNSAFAVLCDSALQQPTGFVHRDYHSRNLMVIDGKALGIIDYQDAVVGPVTYDAVSLLKDCYIDWPTQQVGKFALGFKHRLENSSHQLNCDDATFLRWFDLMGAQRHLKAIGIFARLNHRDGKNGYLKDIPRTLGYVIQTCEKYPSLAPLGQLLETHQIRQRLLS